MNRRFCLLGRLLNQHGRPDLNREKQKIVAYGALFCWEVLLHYFRDAKMQLFFVAVYGWTKIRDAIFFSISFSVKIKKKMLFHSDENKIRRAILIIIETVNRRSVQKRRQCKFACFSCYQSSVTRSSSCSRLKKLLAQVSGACAQTVSGLLLPGKQLLSELPFRIGVLCPRRVPAWGHR